MLFGASDDDDLLPDGDDGIVKQAYWDFQACMDWQGVQDEWCREDIKFAIGDARNMYQWPREIYDSRGKNMPTLTINKTRSHNDMIINELSKNDYGIKVRPAGGKASYKSAEVMEKLFRRIEYISNATTQYRKVAQQQVDGGIGYLIIETRYISSRSRNQDIYLKACQDPTGIYLDPWITETDGSDAGFGFEFKKMSRKTFNRRYPQYKGKVGQAPLDTRFVNWLSDKDITVAKYWRKKQTEDRLVWYKNDDGDELEILASDIKKESGKEIYDQLIQDIDNGVVDGGYRKVSDDSVEWFLIAGDKIVDRGEWAGKYIPICRCPGHEIVIDNTLDRKGHTRPLINAQQMLNYNASESVETVALQTKTPWLAAARAIEGQEAFKDANINNYACLTYQDIDEEAPEGLQGVPAPVRLNPPQASQAHITGMETAERQMMMISGQYQAQMGENDTQSAASGKAINERKEQGDTATYVFPEHMADCKRFAGKQLLDLIPKIYDTDRALQLMGAGAKKAWIRINPNQQEALLELEDERDDEEAVKLSFNPAIGEYECISDPGPDWATGRQEAWNAGTQIITQNHDLTGVIGDLILENGDFHEADKMADRVRREIKATKPYLFDETADPQVMALKQQLAQAQAVNAEMMQKLAIKELAIKSRDERRDIEASRAETDRLKVIVEAMAKIVLPPAELQRMQHELNLRTHDAILDTIQTANQADLQSGSDSETDY